jgi:hypothetical protein
MNIVQELLLLRGAEVIFSDSLSDPEKGIDECDQPKKNIKKASFISTFDTAIDLMALTRFVGELQKVTCTIVPPLDTIWPTSDCFSSENLFQLLGEWSQEIRVILARDIHQKEIPNDMMEQLEFPSHPLCLLLVWISGRLWSLAQNNDRTGSKMCTLWYALLIILQTALEKEQAYIDCFDIQDDALFLETIFECNAGFVCAVPTCILLSCIKSMVPHNIVDNRFNYFDVSELNDDILTKQMFIRVAKMLSVSFEPMSDWLSSCRTFADMHKVLPIYFQELTKLRDNHIGWQNETAPVNRAVVNQNMILRQGYLKVRGRIMVYQALDRSVMETIVSHRDNPRYAYLNSLLQEFNGYHNRISLEVKNEILDYDYFEPPQINPQSEEEWITNCCKQFEYDLNYHGLYRDGILKLFAYAQNENYTMCRFGVVLEQDEDHEKGIRRQVLENVSGELMRLETKGEEILCYVHANEFSISTWHLRNPTQDLHELEQILLSAVAAASGEDGDLTISSCIEANIAVHISFKIFESRKYLKTWDIMAKVLKEKVLK